MKILPPKRYEHANEARFDPIRHERWFKKYTKHAGKYKELTPREQSDYRRWLHLWKTPEQTHQAILDGAYYIYSDPSHRPSFESCIRRVSALFGVKPRPIQNRWELDRNFYPSGYPSASLSNKNKANDQVQQ